MVIIKKVGAKSILDSRNEKTILVTIKTNNDTFSASAPTGKSTGKHEAKTYKKSLEDEIKVVKSFSSYFSSENIEGFDDLRRIEDIADGHLGGNTVFALESATLKALAKERKKEIWELINFNAKKFPRLVGNCIGGGKHSSQNKKPDFQEFLLIPNEKSVEESWELNKKIKKETEVLLKKADEDFQSKKNDENAWETRLNEKEILEILKNFKVNKD